MKIAIIGQPGSGKSTLFTAVTGRRPDEKEALKPHLGTVFVPDERLDNLARMLNPKKITYSEITFLDTHGLDLVRSKEAEALLAVIGVFSGGASEKDASDLIANMILSDLQIMEHRLPVMKKEIEAGKKLKDLQEYNLLLKCKQQLDKARPLREMGLSRDEERLLGGYQFLSLKPMFFAANINENGINKSSAKPLGEIAKRENLEMLELCARTEADILELAEGERAEFLNSAGIAELSRQKILKAAYRTLNLMSFFTVKGEEARSWPLRKGSHALEAAGRVHTDIQRGFIKAEVINYKDFMDCAGFTEAKRRGLLKLEGREYAVQDGDIINFKFSV